MGNSIKRVFVEKKRGFDIEARKLFDDIKDNFEIKELQDIRVINRYDLADISDDEIEKVINLILSEPPVDKVYREEIEFSEDETAFAVEYLPGQFDQRADSASQCIQILLLKETIPISHSKLYILKGNLSENRVKTIKSYLINTIDSREAKLFKPITLRRDYRPAKKVEILEGFIEMNEAELKEFIILKGLAMTLEDIMFCQKYFKDEEKREPTITEIKMLDTYWSDHCRHTTFETIIDKIDFEDSKTNEPIENVFKDYLKSKEFVYGKNKEITLMNLAIIGMKELRKKGKLEDLEISNEINACSIERDVVVDGKPEKWLIMFKNETHNHPTEIEPFGGAATCLGGAIRDPLSGRAFVYQAMRVTGSGDPRQKVRDTVKGKLPQKKITKEAALGYSSYGNQIGLATGLVSEIYNQDYIAKRMEVGAVIGAVPKENVKREEPIAGDIIVLVGGKTGRDGVGGATGSSKEHTEDSVKKAGAEVQKGNAPEERKLQRLFRNKEVVKLIKKSNDFGAGGVSVAIGELADGLEIDLDGIHKKYMGLDGTELALSESQERMAVVLDSNDVDKFIEYSSKENLLSVKIARVTDDNRLVMKWQGEEIVNIDRGFLNTNGVRQRNGVFVSAPKKEENYFSIHEHINGDSIKEILSDILSDLNHCSKKGLVEQFDSTVGATTVFMPFGGKYQSTPMESMVAKIPVQSGNTDTCSIMTYGFNPKIAKWSPFHGAVYSLVEAVSKIIATGGNYSNIRTSLQEYFEKLGKDEKKWGKPFAALLGAYYAHKELGIAAIGGKDSMSGSFKDLKVPPTLISFAINTASVKNVISPEFKKAGNKILFFKAKRNGNDLPDFKQLMKGYDLIIKGIEEGKIVSAHSVTEGGAILAITKMSFGNRIGARINFSDIASLFSSDYGSIILEVETNLYSKKDFLWDNFIVLGETLSEEIIIVNDEKIIIKDIYKRYKEPLEKVFPTETKEKSTIINNILYNRKSALKPRHKAKPRIIIPIFPGTNCEYDTQSAFIRAGGTAETFVFKNRNANDIKESLMALKKEIDNSQIIAIPGGFSAGDEPDGSGKFISTIFHNNMIKDSVMSLLEQRDGLIIGICNGFQALIKLGLVPFGKIVLPSEKSPTLSVNTIGRHISTIARTKIVSNLSPWFNNIAVGDIFSIPVSHGEGRFIAEPELIEDLRKNGQIASQYVDFEGNPSMNIEFNPNGSYNAIEAITSPDGRVLGKMGHSERVGVDLLKNISGNKDQKVFESGVEYFL